MQMNLWLSSRLVAALVLSATLTACEAGSSPSALPNFTVGGNVGGLLPGNSVVLQVNGADRMTIAGNATFTSAAPIASGSYYLVTVASQPAGQTCAVSNGRGMVGAGNIGNVSVVCSINTYKIAVTVAGLNAAGLVLQDNGGDNLSISSNGAVNFSTPVASEAHYQVTVLKQPAGQLCSISSGSGRVAAVDINVAVICIALPNAWTWAGGTNSVGAPGVYGTLGIAAAANVPSARYAAVSWTDPSGNLWLFGGVLIDLAGNQSGLNDLWEYSAGQWKWMGGSNAVDASGSYGTQGTAAPGNVPGARYAANSWIDSSGNFWLFGGQGYDSAGNLGFLNDLWKYSAGQWTWMSGSNTINASGSYGTQGTASASNVPGARLRAIAWIDASDNLWFFGGLGGDSAGNLGNLNDMWEYSAGQWKWVGGSNIANASGSYGTQGVAAAGNVPGGRYAAISWIDSSGNVWLFGGGSLNPSGAQGLLNDLWEYSAGQWKWVGGSNTKHGSATYGTKGIVAAGNVPGGRYAATSWIDASGNAWLFGGGGLDSADQQGNLNDLWEYTGGQWKWVRGSNTVGATGSYGTLGVAAASNDPGARYASTSWSDASGSLLLFGGAQLDSSGNTSVSNDLWKYTP
jgi:Kelch motif